MHNMYNNANANAKKFLGIVLQINKNKEPFTDCYIRMNNGCVLIPEIGFSNEITTGPNCDC